MKANIFNNKYFVETDNINGWKINEKLNLAEVDFNSFYLMLKVYFKLTIIILFSVGNRPMCRC